MKRRQRLPDGRFAPARGRGRRRRDDDEAVRKVFSTRTGRFLRERVRPPSQFKRGSLRTVKTDGHRVVIGCPIWHQHSPGKCRNGGTVTQSILHPDTPHERQKIRSRGLKITQATPGGR